MTIARLSLTDRVSDRCDESSAFPPAVADAWRLAEMFDDIKPDAFSLPTSDTLDSYRPVNLNRMLYRAA